MTPNGWQGSDDLHRTPGNADASIISAQGQRLVPVIAPLAAITAVPLLAVTPAGPFVVMTVSTLAALAAIAGMVIHRPAQRLSWLLLTVMLAGWAVLAVVVHTFGLHGRWERVSNVSNTISQSSAFLLIAWIFAGYLRNRTRPTRCARTGRTVRPRRPSSDVLLLCGILLLVIAQLVISLRPDGESAIPRGGFGLAGDVLLIALILRFLVSRAHLVRSSVLALLGSIAAISFDAANALSVGVARAAGDVPPSDDPAWAFWAVSSCLFAWAALDPSMKYAFDPQTLDTRRSESARLLGLVPLAVVPLGLYVAGRDDAGRLPVSVYLASGAAIAALGLIRAARAVRDNENLAQRDPLTGLANRRGLARAFEVVVHDPDRGVLCLLDVDDFKEVNDTYGHDAGDLLLRELARRLDLAVGETGTVARSGGDEFVLLLGGRHADPAPLLEEVLAEPFEVMGRPRRMRASAGVAPVTPGATLAHVLADADVALYAAKAGGRGGVMVYRPEQRQEVLGRLAMVAALQQALDGHSGAGSLEVHYQPLVELATGRLAGCEALVRWRHPEHGMVRPDVFLGLAEKHGLAARLDRWVLQEALTQITWWAAAGREPVPVSVNLGRSSIESPELADVVLTLLDETGVAPDLLHLEITEHDQLPLEAGAETLRQLAAAGVVISLDDFGVGYTSLDYLRRYPITQLKLDRSITAVLQTAPSSPLLEGIVALARALDVDVVAEGIETQPQQDRLRALGIQLGQGYHLAKPLPAHDLTPLMSSTRTEAGASFRSLPSARVARPAQPA